MQLKNYYLLVGLFSWLTLSINLCTGTNYQEMFLKANEFYKEGKFEQALKLYEQIPNKNAQVYYNQGNCTYKLGKQGQALAFWRRAEHDWGLFNRTELLNNIALIKKQFKKNQHQQDSPFEGIKETTASIKNAIMSFIRALPLVNFQFIFLIMWILSFIYLRYLYRRHQKTIIFILFSINLMCGIFLALKYNFELREHGVIINKQATLMSGPGKNYQVIGELPETCEVTLQKYTDGFYKIKIGSIIGWVESTSIEKY